MHQASKEGDAKFHKIDEDLAEVDHQLNRHCHNLDNQEKTIQLLHERQEQLKEKMESMVRLVEHLSVEVEVCNESTWTLKEKVGKMEGHLCHCTDQGKGKGKEVIQVEEPLVFNYNLDDAYCMAPSTSRVKVPELIPINLDLNVKEVKKVDRYNSCGCGCASHPILLSSDNNISVAENAIPIRIQVECSPSTDQVVSQQHCIRSSGVIHTPKCVCSSKPSHIARLECHTTSSYQCYVFSSLSLSFTTKS